MNEKYRIEITVETKGTLEDFYKKFSLKNRLLTLFGREDDGTILGLLTDNIFAVSDEDLILKAQEYLDESINFPILELNVFYQDGEEVILTEEDLSA